MLNLKDPYIVEVVLDFLNEIEKNCTEWVVHKVNGRFIVRVVFLNRREKFENKKLEGALFEAVGWVQKVVEGGDEDG